MAEDVLIPELRFPEFVDPWVPSLLEDISIRGTGHTPDKKRDEYYNGGIKWISLADSSKLDDGYIDDTKIQISELGIKNSSAVIHPTETVILSRDAGVGKSALMKEDMAVSQHFVTWNGKPNELDNWFLYYKLQILKPLFERMAVGNTIKTIGMPFFKKLSINVPKFKEQQKIASFLTSVDRRIQLLQEKKAQLERYKKGVMQKLFPPAGGQVPEIRFKDEDGYDFPAWEEKRLGEILKVGSGRDYKHLEKGDIPVYGTGGHMLSVNDFLYEGESVCIGRKGTINQPMFLDGKFWTVDTLFYTHEFDGVLPYFVFLLFLQINWQLHNEASGVPSLSKSTIEKIKVAIPSDIREQQSISDFLTELDFFIQKVNTQKEETEKFKKGLLQKMFV